MSAYIKQNSKIITSLYKNIEKLAMEAINFHLHNYEKPMLLWQITDHNFDTSIVTSIPYLNGELKLNVIRIRRSGLKNTMELEFSAVGKNAPIYKSLSELTVELKSTIALLLNEKYL